MNKIEKIRAEIERLKSTNPSEYNYQNAEGYIWALEDIEKFINSLQQEQPDVDMEKETKRWWKEYLHLNPENQLWMDAHQSVVFARHFYELGKNSLK